MVIPGGEFEGDGVIGEGFVEGGGAMGAGTELHEGGEEVDCMGGGASCYEAADQWWGVGAEIFWRRSVRMRLAVTASGGEQSSSGGSASRALA